MKLCCLNYLTLHKYPTERQAYEDSLKYYRDLKNVTNTAREQGLVEDINLSREKDKEEGECKS